MEQQVPAWMKRVHVPQGFPTKSVDTAPTALFLALFFCGALSNMFIFFRNKKRGHWFIFNGLCIGFCMARVVTTSLRLGWIDHIQNENLAIAATIFVAAGVLILFVVNLVFAQRILRGLHPHIGWHKSVKLAFKILYILIPLMLVMVITATIQSFFTTDMNIIRIDIDIQRGASCYLLLVAFLPIPMTLFALLYPKHREPDHFGAKPFWHKSAVLLATSFLLTLGAGFRTGVAFVKPSPTWQTNPPWFEQKWAFYFFNFTMEILTIILYLVFRIDKLFHVQDGSKGPGDYSRVRTETPSDKLTQRTSKDSTDSDLNLEKSEV